LNFTFWSVFPGSQPHIIFFVVRTIYDHFRSRPAMNSPMQLVLNCRKKALRGLSRYVIINGRSIDIGNFLIELTLTQTNLPDTLQLLFKILFTKDRTVIL
jgi:hypothetical protein